MKLIGKDKLFRQLKELDRKLQKKIIRQALREGAKVTQQAAQSEAPSLTGQLRRNIKVRAGKSRKGTISIIVGLSNKWFTGPTFYAGFVEFGHRVGRRELGDSRKEVPANPFLQRAADRTRESAMRRVMDTLRQGIEQAAKGQG